MKSKLNDSRTAVILIWSLPILLLAPNIGLNFTEGYSLLAQFSNILLPWGIYMLWMTLSRKTGLMGLMSLPMMCFAAFQIVLLYLYGGSIIGVDMFLNVVTTNATEVGELLGNLMLSIGLILLLYIPPLVASVVLICHKTKLISENLKFFRKIALAITALGIILTTITAFTEKHYSIRKDLFPVNIFCNLAEAFNRTERLQKFSDTSQAFTYGAEVSDYNGKEIYVMVIGETARAENWQLGGYYRETNPNLSRNDNVVYFPFTLTESNTTHKSVPLLITPLTAKDFNRVDSVKSIISLFNEAGYKTVLLSNQQPNRSYTQFFGDEADEVIYLSEIGMEGYDLNLASLLGKQVEMMDSTDKLFVLMHTYGSHFKYSDRYPESFGKFKPDNIVDANRKTRNNLINAFDNTILYADSLLSEVTDILAAANTRSAMVYASDHGEDIFDDSRERFLHASPVPTIHQLHVPMLVWVSDSLITSQPEVLKNLKNNSALQTCSSESLFHTLVGLSGVHTPYYTDSLALFSSVYKPSGNNKRLFLTDLNEPLLLRESGMKSLDFDEMLRRGLEP